MSKPFGEDSIEVNEIIPIAFVKEDPLLSNTNNNANNFNSNRVLELSDEILENNKIFQIVHILSNNNKANETNSQSTNNNTFHVSFFHIEGMKCHNCSNKVTQILTNFFQSDELKEYQIDFIVNLKEKKLTCFLPKQHLLDLNNINNINQQIMDKIHNNTNFKIYQIKGFIVSSFDNFKLLEEYNKKYLLKEVKCKEKNNINYLLIYLSDLNEIIINDNNLEMKQIIKQSLLLNNNKTNNQNKEDDEELVEISFTYPIKTSTSTMTNNKEDEEKMKHFFVEDEELPTIPNSNKIRDTTASLLKKIINPTNWLNVTNNNKNNLLINVDNEEKESLMSMRDDNNENEYEIELNVLGMHCASCVSKVEESLKKIDGVKSVKVSLLTNSSVVTTTNQSEQLIENLIDKIESLGFNGSLKSTKKEKEEDNMFSNIFKEVESQKENIEKNIILNWKYKFVMSLIFTIPVIILTLIIYNYYCDTPLVTVKYYPAKDKLIYILLNCANLIFASFVHFIVGWHYHVNAFRALRNQYADMNVLLSLSTNAAYFYSVTVLLSTIFKILGVTNWALVDKVDMLHFETAVMVILFQSLGKYLESIAKAKTTESLAALAQLQPPKAHLLEKSNDITFSTPTVEVFVEQIKVGDHVMVKCGHTIPCDGEIVLGQCFVNESMITGESKRIFKKKGSKVIGGTINEQFMKSDDQMSSSGTGGVIIVKITKTGNDTILGQIIRLVQQAQLNKAPIQEFADKISKVFVPIVVLLSLFVFIFWYLASLFSLVNKGVDSFAFALSFTMSVLSVACPCAIGLATPAAVTVGTGLAAKLGILIKGGLPLEIAHKMNCICFDKTGTISTGNISVADYGFFEEDAKEVNITKNQFFEMLIGAERVSEHPLAQSIVNYFSDLLRKEPNVQLTIHQDSNLTVFGGKGLQYNFTVNDQKIEFLIGKASFLSDFGVIVPDTKDKKFTMVKKYIKKGHTVVFCSVNKKLVGYVALVDELKSEAKQVIQTLTEDYGIRCFILSGDHKQAVAHCAKQLSDSNKLEYLFDKTPDEKSKFIKSLQQQGYIVGMVGDGINDSPALTAADCGISIGSGTDVAIKSADIILMKSDLRDVVTTIGLSRKTFERIKINHFLSLGYNLIMIPLACGIAWPFTGIIIPPHLSALLMMFSSLSVMFSSLSLRYEYRNQK
ncbi:hypothetical protein ABK040_000066 [Willaertia magna]